MSRVPERPESPTRNTHANKLKVKTVRMSEDLEERVRRYMEATGATEGAAIRELIERGLMTEGMSLYATPLARFVGDVMQSELEAFRTELSSRNEDLEERLAKVCSRGTKASLASAVMQVDCMMGLFPSMREMRAEEIYEAYCKQAGQLQRGIPFARMKKELSDEA